MKESPDINDTLRTEGEDAARARGDRAQRFNIKVNEPPRLKNDWINRGWTAEQLGSVAEAVKPYTVPFAPILPLDAWLRRDLPQPDFLIGNWLTTTSRMVLSAPTGLGKSMFALALSLAIAAGRPFLHWNVGRPSRVLYIDGEMSRRLLWERLAGEVERLGVVPTGFYPLSHEDIEDFAPLNTPQGQAFIDRFIEGLGGVDLIVFDNIMSLIVGDMKDEESWRETMPWIRKLTGRRIGQIWIHHTGHDENRGYGTKTREWQMDTVALLERVKRPDTDVSFQLHFSKARERTPSTRRDFADVKIALVDNAWSWQSSEPGGLGKVSPAGMKFLDALRDATIGSTCNKMKGCPTATLESWRGECERRGLIEPDKTASARSLFSRHKHQLIVSNHIACNEKFAWTLA
jgi:hypothetical protein